MTCFILVPMNISLIPLDHLLIALIPVALVSWIGHRWAFKLDEIGIAVIRMITQLLLIGYLLVWLFEQRHLAVLGVVLVVMSLVSTWIALRKVPQARMQLFLKTLIVISVCSLFVLVIVVQGVLSLSPTQHPRFVIPLAGMIFSSAMTAVGLAAERFYSDCANGVAYIPARNAAFNASLIPITNSMLAVGLVALPGMMTGQILSGTPPSIAVRYQIVVMCMIFGVAGLSSAGFLGWVAKDARDRCRFDKD